MMLWLECLTTFEPLQPDFNCVKPCKGKTVNLRGVFCHLGGQTSGVWPLGSAPGFKAEGLGLLGCGWGPTMRWMDCLANFGPLQPDFNFMKPCQGKMVNLGGVFRTLGGLMGAPWVLAGVLGILWHGWGPTMRWMDCLEKFGQEENIFILAIFAHFHNYGSTHFFLTNFLQYPKIKCR